MPKHPQQHTLEQTDRRLAERSLIEFTRQCWHILEPANPFVSGWHIEAICEHLEAVSRGEIRNLLINMPPRHMKSLAVSVTWPVWEWLTKPEKRWLFSSYAASLAIRDSLKCRRLIEHPWFQRRWGHVFKLTGDQNAKIRFENDKAGYRIATSVGGSATGEGGDVVAVDDAHNVQERESDLIRESTLIWWDETMSTRLNDQKTGCKLIVMQRVHENDLSGHVLKQGGYVHLCLPAEYEPVRKCRTIIGWEDPRTTPGELLWPERIGKVEIADLKIRLGATGYAGQFQQTPTPAGGGRFKQAWFRRFTAFNGQYRLFGPEGRPVKNVPIDKCDRFMMIDPAGTDKDQNDKACYTVMQVWDVTPDFDMILVHQVREQMETPDVADTAIRTARDYDVNGIWVERDGLGIGVIQTIKRKFGAVHPVKAKGSKEARSETAEILMCNGKIYLPDGAPWLFEFEQELVRFPKSEFKDQVDTLSHSAIRVLRLSGGEVVRDKADSDADLGVEAELAETEKDAGRAERERQWREIEEDALWQEA